MSGIRALILQFSRLKYVQHLAALALTAGLALLLYGHGALWRAGTLGVGDDPPGFVWFLNWWPFAIARGLDPFVTHYIWYPGGFNLAWATSVPFLALVMAPVTLLASPILSFNLLSLAAPALAAWCAYLLAEELTGDWLASLLGGCFYGFSAYETGQLLGHLNLDFTCLVPFILLLSVWRVRHKISRRLYVAGLAACLLAQLGISTEVLATFCFFGALTWMVFLGFAPPAQRKLLVRLAGEIILAVLIMMLLALPFLRAMVQGLADVPTQMNGVQFFATDPRNILIPTALAWLNDPWLEALSRHFTGNGSEQGAYLGLPLLLLLGWYAVRAGRRPFALALLLSMALVLLCSFGPRLQYGDAPSRIMMPWMLGQHLPLLGKALPSRFSQYVALGSGLAVALLLRDLRGWQRRLGLGLALAGMVFLLPVPWLFPWSPWPGNGFFTPSHIEAALGRNKNLLLLPYGVTGPGLAWQVEAKMSFTQSGGYAGYTPLREQDDPGFAALLWNDHSPGFDNALMASCVRHKVDDIVIGPGTPAWLIAAIHALHWPEVTADGVTAVQVPPVEELGYYTISGDYWPSFATRNWMGKRITITTRAAPLHLNLLGIWTRPTPGQRVRVMAGGHEADYPVTPQTDIPVDIPAHSTAVIEANKTWRPATDPRDLSVIVEITAP